MPLDSKAIDKLLAATLFAAARAHGFVRGRGRTAWRRHAAGIDVLDVQGHKWNEYGASPRLSFYLNLGVALDAVPPVWTAPSEQPREESCSFRSRLTCVPASDAPLDGEQWLFAGDGHDATAVAERMAASFLADGLAWYHHFATPERLLDTMLGSNAASVPELAGLSPERHQGRQRDVAYLALASGRPELAVAYFDQVLASAWPLPPAVREQMAADRGRAAAQADLRWAANSAAAAASERTGT